MVLHISVGWGGPPIPKDVAAKVPVSNRKDIFRALVLCEGNTSL